MSYFAWVRSRSLSGHLVAQKTPDRPWDPQTNVSAKHDPVVFQRQLDADEEELTLGELITKYPAPTEKKT